jgi:mannose-6-phosphate isomerase-like protein (cupin superfamily)
MMHVLRAADRPPAKSRTIKFEGGEYGADVSFFAVDNDPGQGPGLHTHPYTEIWIVKEGRARIQAGTQVIEAGVNDIAIVPPNVPHGFRNIGEGRLEILCIHDTGTMVQINLTDEESAPYGTALASV